MGKESEETKRHTSPQRALDNDIATWDIYYATLVGMAEHPGYTREGTEKPTLETLANRATKMLVIRNALWREEWP